MLVSWTILSIYQHQILKKYKKGMDSGNKKNNKKIYINAEQHIPVPYGSMLHIPLTNLLLLAATQQPYKEASLLMKNIEEFLEKVQENVPAGRKK